MSSIYLSWVIASRNPQKLSEFYAFATKGDLRDGVNKNHFLVVRDDGLNIQVYKPAEKRSWPKPGRRTALCLQQVPSSEPLFSAREWTQSLVVKGAVVVEEPKLEFFGAESWMKDPEGNYFLILVPLN